MHEAPNKIHLSGGKAPNVTVTLSKPDDSVHFHSLMWFLIPDSMITAADGLKDLKMFI